MLIEEYNEYQSFFNEDINKKYIEYITQATINGKILIIGEIKMILIVLVF